MTDSPSLAPHGHSADLTLALSLADAADHITMSRFESSDLRIETKPDLSPVSDADTAVEKSCAKSSPPKPLAMPFWAKSSAELPLSKGANG